MPSLPEQRETAIALLRQRFPDARIDWLVESRHREVLLDNPDVNGIVLNARDVTERHAMELQLRHQAFHDSLTGLANRLRFTERLEHSLLRGREDGRGKPFCVLYMDLDHFKNVNDELGHGIGVALLRDVAHRLLACLRPSDTCARLGGDELRRSA